MKFYDYIMMYIYSAFMIDIEISELLNINDSFKELLVQYSVYSKCL